jgi:hypothetical protein
MGGCVDEEGVGFWCGAVRFSKVESAPIPCSGMDEGWTMHKAQGA